MDFQFSAGVIVYAYFDAERKFLFLKDHHGNAGPPKGHIDKGESAHDAALRETLEESGLGVNPDAYYRDDVHYIYTENGEKVNKSVAYFIAEVKSDVKVRISPEHVGYEWLSLKEFPDGLPYKNSSIRNAIREIYFRADSYIDKIEKMDALNKEYSMLPKKQRSWSLSKNFVPGEGPLNAKVAIIGQAPGRNEDEQRRPFVGAAGKLLDHLIRKAGLKREKVFITSIVQFFPPENRLPTQEEANLCMPFLKRQLEIVKPKYIILLGNFAAQNIDGMGEIMKNHGKLVKSKEYGCYLYATLHPAAAVRIKKHTPIIEEDFAKLKEILKSE